ARGMPPHGHPILFLNQVVDGDLKVREAAEKRLMERREARRPDQILSVRPQTVGHSICGEETIDRGRIAPIPDVIEPTPSQLFRGHVRSPVFVCPLTAGSPSLRTGACSAERELPCPILSLSVHQKRESL